MIAVHILLGLTSKTYYDLEILITTFTEIVPVLTSVRYLLTVFQYGQLKAMLI